MTTVDERWLVLEKINSRLPYARERSLIEVKSVLGFDAFPLRGRELREG